MARRRREPTNAFSIAMISLSYGGGTLCDFPLAQLSGFPDHEEHFPLYTGARLEDMVESIRRHGVQSPFWSGNC